MVYRRRALSPLFVGLAMCAPAGAGAPPAAVPIPAQAPADAPVPAAAPAPRPEVPRPEAEASSQDSVRPVASVVRTGPELTAAEQELFQRIIRPRLARDQWKTPARYDAAYIYMLPLHAAHPVDAMMWIDYFYRPEVQALIADWVWYISPVPDAKPIIAGKLGDPTVADSPYVFPTPDIERKFVAYYDPKGVEDQLEWTSIFDPIIQS